MKLTLLLHDRLLLSENNFADSVLLHLSEINFTDSVLLHLSEYNLATSVRSLLNENNFATPWQAASIFCIISQEFPEMCRLWSAGSQRWWGEVKVDKTNPRYGQN